MILGVYATPLRTVDRADLTSSLAVTQRAFELGMYYRARPKFHHPDLFICPQGLSRFPTFGTRHYQEIYEVGYRATRERIDEIREILDRRA